MGVTLGHEVKLLSDAIIIRFVQLFFCEKLNGQFVAMFKARVPMSPIVVKKDTEYNLINMHGQTVAYGIKKGVLWLGLSLGFVLLLICIRGLWPLCPARLQSARYTIWSCKLMACQ